jgi:hypothetical protein
VLMSTLESQQPKPGCEWYQPTTVSGLLKLCQQISRESDRIDIPSSLSQHVHHLSLEDRVHSFNRHAGTRLGHGEDIHHANSVVIHELSQHKSHDFHRHTSPSVPEHLQECERRDVDGFGIVNDVGVLGEVSALV